MCLKNPKETATDEDEHPYSLAAEAELSRAK
jgi:hypothetical protein